MGRPTCKYGVILFRTLWLLNNNQLNQLWEMERLLTIYKTMGIEDEERAKQFA